MIVIGVDAPQGWCCLDVSAGKGRLLGLGTLDTGDEAVELARYITRYRPALVVIERPSEIYLGGRGDEGEAHVRRSVGAGLISTAEVSGEMRHACRIANVKCKMTDANEVRRCMKVRGRSREEKDRDVARVVGMLVADWPRRTNTHERDAALAALWGGQ